MNKYIINIFCIFLFSVHISAMNTDITEEKNQQLFQQTPNYPLLTIPLDNKKAQKASGSFNDYTCNITGLSSFKSDQQLTIIDDRGPRVYDIYSGKEKHSLWDYFINRFHRRTTSYAISQTKGIIYTKKTYPSVINLCNTWHQIPLKGDIKYTKNNEEYFRRLLKAEISNNDQYLFLNFLDRTSFGYGQTVELFNTQGKKLQKYSNARAATFSPDGQLLYVVNQQGPSTTIKKIDLSQSFEAIEILGIPLATSQLNSCNMITASKNHLALGFAGDSGSGYLYLVKLSNSPELLLKREPESIHSFCFSSDEKYLIYSDFRGNIHCFEIQSKNEYSFNLDKIRSKNQTPGNLVCSPSGTHISFELNDSIYVLPFFLGLSPENKK